MIWIIKSCIYNKKGEKLEHKVDGDKKCIDASDINFLIL